VVSFTPLHPLRPGCLRLVVRDFFFYPLRCSPHLRTCLSATCYRCGWLQLFLAGVCALLSYRTFIAGTAISFTLCPSMFSIVLVGFLALKRTRGGWFDGGTRALSGRRLANV